ncbi:hypothetical protein SANTM175S_06433 [Streptomyces antimycoticus]
MSLAKPPLGRDLGGVVSLKTAGSRGAEPYTLVLDFTTSRCTDGAFWQAPRSCMVPMTLVSLIEARLPRAPAESVDIHVDDRVDAVFGEQFPDRGMTDIGPDEVGAAEVVFGRYGVHADHPLHIGFALFAGRNGLPAGETPVTSTTFPKISAFLPTLVRAGLCRTP